MRFVWLGEGEWSVAAYVDDEGDCPTLDHMRGAKCEGPMLSLIRESVPKYGPQKTNTELCRPMKPLSDRLWEWRKQPRVGPKLRVIFFEADAGKLLICVTSFQKTKTTPEWPLKLGRAVREQYFKDCAAGIKSKFVELEEL